MDTNTVLEIIKMIQDRIKNNAINCINNPASTETIACFRIGERRSLIELRDYLQDHIDAELSAFESTLGQAE